MKPLEHKQQSCHINFMVLSPALRPQVGTAQRQRLGMTQDVRQSLQYLALAGLRLEQSLQRDLEVNPFLSVTGTHPAHVGEGWLENLAAPTPDSLAAVLRSTARDLFWQETDRALAFFLIDHIAPTGLLESPLDRLDLPHGTDVDRLRQVRNILMEEEPAGLLADTLGQSFAAQLGAAGDLTPAAQSLCDNLEMLAAKGLAATAQVLDLDPDEAGEAVETFRALRAHPADGLDLDQPLILPPDLLIDPADKASKAGGWRVRLNPLVNRTYGLDEEALEGLSAAARSKEDIQQQIQKAKATVRALRARGQTLVSLTKLLALEQSDALHEGRHRVRPLSQAQVAETLELHPSTISRAISHKTAQTPHGIWPLKSFFSALIDPGTELSAARLRHLIAQQVATEDRDKPLSDAALARGVQDRGHQVARRTVTKYRLALHLPAASERARQYAAGRNPVHQPRKDPK